MTDRTDREGDGADRSDCDGRATSGGLTQRATAGAIAVSPIRRRALAKEGGRDPSLFDGATLLAAYRDRSRSPTEVITSVYARAEGLNPAGRRCGS